MSPQAGFVLQDQVVPRLRSAIPRSASCIGSEDAEELIQDSIAMAAKMMHNVEAAGKKVTPGNIAYYTIQHVRSGRRSTGSSVADVLGSGTQLLGNTRLNSMEEVVSEAEGDEIFELHDVLALDDEDPATKAARKIDWEEFMSGLSSQEQAIIAYMVEGITAAAMSRKLRLKYTALRTSKQNLSGKILEYMGEDILIRIQRRPDWKNSLNAAKERMACKYSRC